MAFFNINGSCSMFQTLNVYRNLESGIVINTLEQLGECEQNYISMTDNEAIELAGCLIRMVKKNSKLNVVNAEKLSKELKLATCHKKTPAVKRGQDGE